VSDASTGQTVPVNSNFDCGKIPQSNSLRRCNGKGVDGAASLVEARPRRPLGWHLLQEVDPQSQNRIDILYWWSEWLDLTTNSLRRCNAKSDSVGKLCLPRPTSPVVNADGAFGSVYVAKWFGTDVVVKQVLSLAVWRVSRRSTVFRVRGSKSRDDRVFHERKEERWFGCAFTTRRLACNSVTSAVSSMEISRGTTFTSAISATN